jgi:hypothetical protein
MEIHVDKIKRQAAPTTMDWHPEQKVLAIGWETGTLSLFNHEQGIS